MAGGVIAGAGWLLFIGWLCWHAFAELREGWAARRPGPRVDDRTVAARLYPEGARRVRRLPGDGERVGL